VAWFRWAMAFVQVPLVERELAPEHADLPGRTAELLGLRDRAPPLQSGLVQRPSSAAAAALSTVMTRRTRIAAAVCCSLWFVGLPALPLEQIAFHRI
jgi:hypothetical protein